MTLGKLTKFSGHQFLNLKSGDNNISTLQDSCKNWEKKKGITTTWDSAYNVTECSLHINYDLE